MKTHHIYPSLLLALTFGSLSTGNAQSSLEEDGLQQTAKELCTEKSEQEKSVCEKDRLAMRRYARSIFRKCQTLDSDAFKRCAKTESVRVPAAYRSDAAVVAQFENELSWPEQEGKRKLAAIERCTKAGMEEGSVRLKMKRQTVLDCGWGAPEKINRTITSSHIDEQWVYGEGRYLYFRNGILDSIQD